MSRGKIHVRGSEEALDIARENVSEGHVGTESRLLNAYGSPVLLQAKMKIEPPLDVKRMSLNLTALAIAWEETSAFRSY